MKQPTMMIFIPLRREDALAVRQTGGQKDDLDAYAATGELIAAHDYRPDEREDADYAAQLYASVAGLADGDDYCRLVVAAEVPLAGVSDGRTDREYGAIRVRGLDWADVTAVFVDEAEAADAVRDARKAVGSAEDQGLESLLELPEVAALTTTHELLWHTPDEDW